MKPCRFACSLTPWLVLAAFLPRASAADAPRNVALAAQPSTSFVSGHESILALNDGYDPRNSGDKSHGAYGNWAHKGTEWVQYDWSQPIHTNKIDVYWFDDHRGVRTPKACRLSYWDGKAFVPVANPQGLGVKENQYNTTTFDAVKTTRLRLEMDPSRESTGILEWKVYDAGESPNFKPTAIAGPNRVLIVGTKTWLDGKARDDGKPGNALTVAWSKESGPGDVTFADPKATSTTATFSAPGSYVLKLTANDGELTAADSLTVRVEPAPTAAFLQPIHTYTYQVSSPLWRDRLKKLIVNWVPHCYTKCSDPEVKEGGIENFTEAGKKNAGQPHKPHRGPVFANAWVHNTTEAMCVALMVDPQGDPEIIAAQKAIREKLEDWVPKLISAQEPDGYLQTAYTLANRKRWSNKHDHEGYLAGYFIESGIAHHIMTGRKDNRMYDAAKKLADCWVNNIGPAPKRAWYEGHQELEMALVRLARYVDEVEGAGKGRKYVELAKFLMDSRGGGDEYDQSHQPVTRQYEAVGHAVRAVYSYAGMADLAMETGDIEYHGAIRSIWDNLIHRKYYITGGVGSGETSEGFGKDYSLPNHSYCESCAGCGQLFFMHKMHRIDHHAKHADLFEETIFNAILGSIDMEGKNFTYTNGLDAGGARYPWHGCPCCVGNIPRTLLSLPTWMYTTDDKGLYVNLFAGTTVNVGKVAGTDLQMVQTTNYPWDPKVTITVNPAAAKEFAIRIRIPARTASELYTATPATPGLTSLTVNGAAGEVVAQNGYVVLTRTWKPGDTIAFELPMPIQRVKCSDKVKANLGRVALRRGPIVYNIEATDGPVDGILAPNAPLTTEWKPELLNGVMVIKGAFTDGKPLTAIPNYARQNRGGRSIVWIKDQ